MLVALQRSIRLPEMLQRRMDFPVSCFPGNDGVQVARNLLPHSRIFQRAARALRFLQTSQKKFRLVVMR
jgi:hypothetical protein